MFKAIKGFLDRGLCRCKALATSSLPVPDLPFINTVIFDLARRPIARKTSCMAGASPIISGVDSAACASGGEIWRLLC